MLTRRLRNTMSTFMAHREPMRPLMGPFSGRYIKKACEIRKGFLFARIRNVRDRERGTGTQKEHAKSKYNISRDNNFPEL